MVGWTHLTSYSIVLRVTKDVLIFQVAKLLLISWVFSQHLNEIFFIYGCCLDKGFCLDTKLDGLLQEELPLTYDQAFFIITQIDVIIQTL